MKIIDLTTEEVEAVKVRKAKYLGDYVLRIFFSDGHESAVDLKPFLKKHSHPSIKKYLNEVELKKFRVVHGNLNWNDYELIFPIEHLYKGYIK